MQKRFSILFNVGFATIKMRKTRRVPLALNFALGHIVGFARICRRQSRACCATLWEPVPTGLVRRHVVFRRLGAKADVLHNV